MHRIRAEALKAGADVQGEEKGKEALTGLQGHPGWGKGVPRLPQSQGQPWRAAACFHMEQGELQEMRTVHENPPAAE